MAELKVEIALEAKKRDIEKIKKQIEKAFTGIGVGGGMKDISVKMGESPIFKGMSGNIGKIVMGLTKGLAFFGLALEALGKIKNFMSEVSPMFKGVIDIFGRAWLYFWKPFGDFLAVMLKPLAIQLLKFTVEWHKFWKGDIGTTILEAFTIAFQEVNPFAAFDEITDVGEFFATFIKGDIPDFSIWLKAFMPESLLDFAGWLGGFITESIPDFGIWLEQFILEPIRNFGDWLGGFITGGAVNIIDFFKSLIFPPEPIRPPPLPRNIPPTPGWGGGTTRGAGATGTWQYGGIVPGPIGQPVSIVAHGGEEFKGFAGSYPSQGKIITYKPTFIFSGSISSDVDVDSMIRRASRESEIELKRRGLAG